jgi:hypothetical protein
VKEGKPMPCEEQYTLSDPRVSFEELLILFENLQNLQIDN